MTKTAPAHNPANPHGFDDETLDALADTSLRMYDDFYDLLASYQFGFTPEQKAWMLAQVVKDITTINELADQGD